jgi:hypothetical protein
MTSLKKAVNPLVSLVWRKMQRPASLLDVTQIVRTIYRQPYLRNEVPVDL